MYYNAYFCPCLAEIYHLYFFNSYVINASCRVTQGNSNSVNDDIIKRNNANVKGLSDINHFNASDNQNHVHENRLVILVVSNAKNQDLRNAQRDAFNQTMLNTLGMKRIFLLFVDEDNISQEIIEEESKMHLDIVQGSMIEDYKNLAYKHLMGLQWAADECRHFR